MFWAKLKTHRLTTPFMYALATVALMEVSIFGFNAQWRFAKEEADRTTVDNIEGRVREWLDNFGLTVRKRSDTASAEFFRYVVTMRNDDKIELVRPRNRDHYIVLVSRLVFPAEEWRRLTPAQIDKAASAITLELTRGRVTFTTNPPYSEWSLERRIPIAPNLSERDLIRAVDEMDSTIASVQAIGHPFLRAH